MPCGILRYRAEICSFALREAYFGLARLCQLSVDWQCASAARRSYLRAPPSLGPSLSELVSADVPAGIPPQVAQMARIDRQIAGKGAAQNLVGRDEWAQPFVDLAIETFATGLDGKHHEQANAHTDQRHEGEASQRHKDGLPGTEIDISQNPHSLFQTIKLGKDATKLRSGTDKGIDCLQCQRTCERLLDELVGLGKERYHGPRGSVAFSAGVWTEKLTVQFTSTGPIMRNLEFHLVVAERFLSSAP
jgi:hypothetical protein